MSELKSSIVRFHTKYSKQLNGCWEWTDCLNIDGYGAFQYNGKTWRAHRFLYKYILNKDIRQIQILHKCDNRKCVNPDHLFEGNNTLNMEDRKRKGRYESIRLSMQGEKSKFAKVNTQQVKEIRILNPLVSRTFLKSYYNLSDSGINDIVTKRRWSHVLSVTEKEIEDTKKKFSSQILKYY